MNVSRSAIFLIWVLTIVALGGCEKSLHLKKTSVTPASVFDQVWTEIDRNYALFSLKSVDWDSVYQAFRPRVDSAMTESQLFSLLNEMLQTLRDGHVALFSGNDTAFYVGFYRPFPVNFSLPVLIHAYLHDQVTRSGPLVFTTVSETGYIYDGSFDEDLRPETLDSILRSMNGVKGLILDLRSNTGGHTGHANLLFSRLLASATTVKFEQVKNGIPHNALAGPAPLQINPAGFYFSKPIVLLTNRLCYSACNDFVAYTRTIANVVRVGDRTGGGGGVPAAAYLSNGWKLQYTASKTLDAQLQPIEDGITPDVYREITVSDEAAGRDPILEYAFSVLQ